VVSGWGFYRSMRCETLKPLNVGLLYGVVFGMLVTFYTTMLLSLSHLFDLVK
jgi:hypothetical protein